MAAYASCTNALGGNHAYVDSKRWDRNGVILHEAGHMAGLTDRYKLVQVGKNQVEAVPDKGYANSIMADTTARHINQTQINEAEKNKTTTQCTQSSKGVVSC